MYNIHTSNIFPRMQIHQKLYDKYYYFFVVWGKIIILHDFFDDGYLVEQEANEVSVNNFMGRNILMKA